jgi:beta-1,4-mannosyltransferase
VPSLRSLPHIHFLYLPEPPRALSQLPFVLFAPLKVIHQIATILIALLSRIPHTPEFILVQVSLGNLFSARFQLMLTLKNPPSIPTLALVWMVGRLRGSKVIIDWHNLGYTILALKLGKKHPLVTLAEKYVVYGLLWP